MFINMLVAIQINRAIKHWLEGADDNYKTMQSLYRSKRYSACLFFGHLILEKVLKALVVKYSKDYAPRVHNLLYLAELANIDNELSLEQKKFLAVVNDFNMETRYPEEKYNFYKKCDKKFTDKYYFKIKIMYSFLCQQIKPKE